MAKIHEKFVATVNALRHLVTMLLTVICVTVQILLQQQIFSPQNRCPLTSGLQRGSYSGLTPTAHPLLPENW